MVEIESSTIAAYIDEDEQKVIILPVDDEYSINITATDNGTVTYTATEYNVDNGETEKVISYYEIDVLENDTLVGLVENLNEVTSAQYPLYFDGSDKSLIPSVEQHRGTVQKLTVEVSKSGNGTVIGGGSYVSGEFAKVTAIADTGATFLGWYEDDVLVSSNAEYRFLVNKDVRLIAKFTETPDSPDTPVTPAPSYPPIGGPSGTSNPDNPATYNITIRTVSNGKVTATPTSAAKGTIVTLTATPDSGYELSSFTVADSKGNELKLTDKGDGKYTFTMPDSAVTVDAVFKLIEQSSTPSDWANPFTDVATPAWYYDAVKYVSEKELMNGTGGSLFSPEATTTRAMIWTILARLADVDTTGSDPWYEKGQAWAIAKQISDGTTPDASITREQLITMLWRYKGSPNATADLSRFTDNGTVSNWAKDAIEWAVSTGLLQGSDGKLDPTGTATRAQVAAVLQRYCETLA